MSKSDSLLTQHAGPVYFAFAGSRLGRCEQPRWGQVPQSPSFNFATIATLATDLLRISVTNVRRSVTESGMARFSRAATGKDHRRCVWSSTIATAIPSRPGNDILDVLDTCEVANETVEPKPKPSMGNTPKPTEIDVPVEITAVS